MQNRYMWKKPILILSVLLGLMYILPSHPIDPWQLLSLKKIVTLIFTLLFIQVIGSLLLLRYGHKTGALITGFLGGLASSTATTAGLAHRSRTANKPDLTTDTLTFLAATSAMLFEGFTVIFTGVNQLSWSWMIIFLTPILYVLTAIWRISQNETQENVDFTVQNLEIRPVLQLTAFIVIVLSLSKYIQRLIGQNALLLLTFVVSLFEIHGSMIANVQLLNADEISSYFFGLLVTISIFASLISKLFLVKTLGSPALTRQIAKHTFFIFLSLALGGGLFLLS